jgi:hypothetical protein
MYVGRHILKITNASSQWIGSANHSLRKSIEEFQLLFPIYDTVAIEDELVSGTGDQESLDKTINQTRTTMSDTIEDVNEEIEEMKKEIASIVIIETPSHGQRFDLPKINLGGPSDGKTVDKRRKDRYSACVLAHDSIQYIITQENKSNYEVHGGTSETLAANKETGAMYRGLPAGVTHNVTGPISVSINTSSGGRIVY